MVNLKNNLSLKAESFYMAGIFRTLCPADSISNDPERIAPRRWGEESGYEEACNKGQVVWISKYYCWSRKTRNLKLLNLALFYVWGKKCKSVGSLKSCLSNASQLSRASFLSFSHPHKLSKAHPGSGWWLLHSRYWSSWVPSVLRNSHLEAWNPWWFWHPVYWYGRKYSISLCRT